MTSIIKKWSMVVLSFWSFVFVSTASADSLTLINPLGQNSSFQTVLDNVNLFLLAIAAPITGIMVVWGGFQMITAAGNPEKFSSGKKTLLYAAIGFAIVIFASSVVPLIQSIFGTS